MPRSPRRPLSIVSANVDPNAFEQYARNGLALAGIEVDEIDVAVMRATYAAYGDAQRALLSLDVRGVIPETHLDPSRAPE